MRLSKSNHPCTFTGFGNDVQFACCDLNGQTGLTLVLGTMSCYQDVRGGWAGYLTSLSPNSKNVVDGICIAGGSMMGLSAVCGVTNELWNQYQEIKNIEGAVIFSQNLQDGDCSFPTVELGAFAYKNVEPNILYSGQVGAGTRASKGQGVSCAVIEGYNVLCIIVNNAVGDVIVESQPQRKRVKKESTKGRKNTAITVVITDMILDYYEQKQMATQLHASIARSIEPFNTFQDGDILYLCSTQKVVAKDDLLTDFTWEVEKVLKQAVQNSILK